VLAALPPASSDPLDVMALILLLDQIPRNTYRGSSAGTVFIFFDPLAVAVAKVAVESGVPDKTPIRGRIAYRMWLGLPLMHSEDPAMHALLVESIKRIREDIDEMAADSGRTKTDGDEDWEVCRAAVLKDVDVLMRFRQQHEKSQVTHTQLIERFGRYPHRNAILGREPTEEETEFLKNGVTFGM
jgi:uncharacterized protein (DUF924 family)